MIIFIGNWDHKVVPKHLLFVICWQFNQFSCLPSSIFNVPIEICNTLVCMGRMSSYCYAVAYPWLPYVAQSTSCFFSCDTSEMVPIATSLRWWKWRCCIHPQHTVLTMPVIKAAASACSDLPRPSLVLFPSSSSHWAHSEIQRLAVNDLSLV